MECGFGGRESLVVNFRLALIGLTLCNFSAVQRMCGGDAKQVRQMITENPVQTRCVCVCVMRGELMCVEIRRAIVMGKTL